MDGETSDVVQRLGRSRSTALLRLIDDAELERPVEAEPNPAAIVDAHTAPEPESRGAERSIELTITLRDTHPPIWRCLVVPASLTLHELHDVLQPAMGWLGYHLHMFDVGGVLYGDVEEFQGRPLGEEDSFTVGQAADVVANFSYQYDFGDSWDHDVRVEHRITTIGSGTPQLIAGARACPPEDCGGTPGYEHLLTVLADRHHEEHEELLRWVGGQYDPEAFDLAQTNANLELLDRHTRRRGARRERRPSES
jgi:Plasmid pRiA4b ORF-3-like protein